MDSDALHLLLCVTGLFNETSSNLPSSYDSHDNHTAYVGGPLNSVSNSTGAAGAAWLGDVIKTKLVPVVCVFGIVGNCLTLVVLAFEQVRSAAGAERKVNIWLQALAVSDLLLCFVLLPHGLMTYGDRSVCKNFSFFSSSHPSSL